MNDTNILRSEKPSYEIPDISVGQYVYNRLQELNKESVCLIEANSDSRLTSSQLITKSKAIGTALIDSGVNKSDIIVTFAECSPEHSIVLFAATFLGSAIHPIIPILNVYELENVLKTLGPIVLITTQLRLELIHKVLNKNPNQINVKKLILLDGNPGNSFVTFDDLLKDGSNRSLDKIPYFNVDPKNDICFMLQSSGTSGVPKSVMLTHRSFLATILGFKNTPMDGLEYPIFAHTTYFGYITGITFQFSLIPHGIPFVIYNNLSDESILRSIDKYRVNFMYTTPPFASKLIDESVVNKYDLSSLKQLFTGGSAFPPSVGNALVKKYNVALNEGYGMTEFMTITDFKPEPNQRFIAGNVGKISQNSEMKIIDINSGLSLGPDLDGEVCVRGPKMFYGYFNNKAAAEEAIDKDGWLHTGDIGHYDRENRLFITDRLKELIKYQTKSVSPTEIEQFLLTHKCVAEVAVVGVKHPADVQWPRAYVKVKPNMSVTEEELKTYVSDNLNLSKHLRAGVVFVDNIPRTIVGKVSRKYFKTLVANEIIE